MKKMSDDGLPGMTQGYLVKDLADIIKGCPMQPGHPGHLLQLFSEFHKDVEEIKASYAEEDVDKQCWLTAMTAFCSLCKWLEIKDVQVPFPLRFYRLGGDN